MSLRTRLVGSRWARIRHNLTFDPHTARGALAIQSELGLLRPAACRLLPPAIARYFPRPTAWSGIDLARPLLASREPSPKATASGGSDFDKHARAGLACMNDGEQPRIGCSMLGTYSARAAGRRPRYISASER